MKDGIPLIEKERKNVEIIFNITDYINLQLSFDIEI